jgi:hypothetical protein
VEQLVIGTTRILISSRYLLQVDRQLAIPGSSSIRQSTSIRRHPSRKSNQHQLISKIAPTCPSSLSRWPRLL